MVIQSKIDKYFVFLSTIFYINLQGKPRHPIRPVRESCAPRLGVWPQDAATQTWAGRRNSPNQIVTTYMTRLPLSALISDHLTATHLTR